MQIKNTSLFLLILVGTVAVSCKEKEGRQSTKVEYDSIVVARHVPLIHENDTTQPYADVKISFIYPTKFRDGESLTRLQKIFQGTFFADKEYDSYTPQEAVDLYLKEYTDRYQDLSNFYYEDKTRLEGKMPEWYWYFMHNRNEILFKNDYLLSYAVEYSDYEGGAHGSFRITYTNIDLKELVTILEDDLFKPDYYEPLKEKIITRLMKNYDVTDPDSLLTRGFFTLEDIVPNNNFWLDGDSIHYAYNQYEIAPYFMGIIEVSLPYSDLSDILLPDGLISKYYPEK